MMVPEQKEFFEYEKVYRGYIMHNVGAIGGTGLYSMASNYSINTKAIKDEAFRRMKFNVVPIDEKVLTLEEMKDDTKVRRFEYYLGHEMSKLIEFCTIKDDESLDMDMTAYNKKYPNNGGDPNIFKYESSFIVDYWGDEIRESMAARAKGPRVITSSGSSTEAAKDEVFRGMGFDVSPIGEKQLTLEEMEDDTKVRRFKYYESHDLTKIVEFATIKEDGTIEVDEDSYCKSDSDYHEFNLRDCGGYKNYLLRYYTHDILESMKKRDK